MRVPDSPYGIRKAKLHGQAEANRTGYRIYLQFDRVGEKLEAIYTQGWITFPNAPFFTFYPQGGSR